MRRFVVVLAVVLLCVASVGWTQAAEFPIKPNDVVVMAGDSITAQHLHSNYIEGYCLARFPKWNLRFRNSGVGGDTVPKVLARLDWDVLAWKPMVVTIELGMNDSGGGLPGVEGYLKGMETLIQRIKAAGARPMFLTASPVNDGTTADKLAGRNLTLDKMATEIKALAAKNGLPCADQFHAVLDMWGKNKKNPNGINLVGDPVHPGAPGQLTMAHACLVGLGAPALVSKATIDASGKATEQVKCTVTNVKAEGDKLSFERLDEALPMPIPDDARTALPLIKLGDDLSQYILTVTGLKAEKYDVAIDGAKVATVTAKELAAGWNMGLLDKGPVADQLRQVLGLISAKANEVRTWREVSKFQPPAWLGDLSPQVLAKKNAELARCLKLAEDADAKIHASCQPKPRRFELTPAK